MGPVVVEVSLLGRIPKAPYFQTTECHADPDYRIFQCALSQAFERPTGLLWGRFQVLAVFGIVFGVRPRRDYPRTKVSLLSGPRVDDASS